VTSHALFLRLDSLAAAASVGSSLARAYDMGSSSSIRISCHTSHARSVRPSLPMSYVQQPPTGTNTLLQLDGASFCHQLPYIPDPTRYLVLLPSHARVPPGSIVYSSMHVDEGALEGTSVYSIATRLGTAAKIPRIDDVQ
jgi:hypothetical protein